MYHLAMSAPLTCRIARLSSVITLVFAAVATLLSVTCSQAADSPAKAGVGRSVRVGIYNFKPMVYAEADGSVHGFFVKILTHVARKNNWDLHYVPGTWQEGMDRLKSNQIDLLPCIGYTEERDKYLDFPKEFLVMDWGLVYKTKGSSINSIMDLEGKKVSVLKGSAYAVGFQELVKKFQIDVTIKEMSQASDVLESVVSRAADAGVAANLSGILNDTWQRVERTPIIFNPIKLGYGANGSMNADLLEALDREISALKADKASLFYNEFEHMMGNKENEIPKEMYWGISGVAAALFLAISFIVILRREIHTKTLAAVNSAIQYKTVSLRQSAILTAVPDIIMETDTNKVYTWANPAGFEFFGDDVVGKEASFYFDGPQNTYQIIQHLFNKSEQLVYVESLQRRKDGAPRLLAWWSKALVDELGVVTGVLSTARDITDSKSAEQKLDRYLQFLNKTGELARVGGWELTLTSMDLFWSEQTYRIHEMNPDKKITVEEAISFYVPEAKPVIKDAVKSAIESGTPFDLELQIITALNNHRWVRAQGEAEYNEGKVSKVYGTFQDITDRKQIEEVQSYLLQINSLNPGEDFFESLARYLATILGMDYVCIDTLHGDCLSARTLAIYNDGRFEDNVEYTLKDTPCGDVVGKEVCVFPRGVSSLFPHDAALQDLQAESYVGTTLWSFDMKPIGLIAVIGRKELSSSRFAETVLKLVSIRAAGELERRSAEEEKQALEQQFQQTQKLESLGVLAGGIAHDFNNILAIIIGYCGLIKIDYESAEKNIPEIENAAERAAALCRQMLAYAGKASLTQTQLEMRGLVNEMISMLNTTLKQNIVIRPNIGTDIPAITGDASQIRQVVMNLIINAAEAIGDDQGEIVVSLKQTEIVPGKSDKDHLGMTIAPGRYICLEVIDTGCGMSEEIRGKIFEPFYTTKFTGRGLGMSAVLGIIKAHKGALQLESQPGQGTVFKVYLPTAPGSSETVETQRKAASAPWQGRGTVLLAEDEVQVQLIAAALLKKLGFTVIAAANGREALELYQQHAADITMVVTDMGMPVMNGYELFHTLKQLDPELPIIISSGFGETDVTDKIPRDQMAGLINKPYNFEQFRDVLRAVVEG